MTFTAYDASLVATDNRTYLRSLLNDKTAGKGPFPEGNNFQDEELDAYLSKAGTVNAAFVQCCKILAAAWSSHARLVRGTALTVNATEVAEQWREAAKDALKNPVDSAAARTTFKVFNASTD